MIMYATNIRPHQRHPLQVPTAGVLNVFEYQVFSDFVKNVYVLRTTFPKGRAEKRRFLQRETTPFARYSGFREDRVFYDESGLCIQHNGGRSEQNGRRSVNSVGAARSVPGCI